jgi:pyruvate dehydrogenase E2 component (dihydrolipoamide acetyltransferase)
LYGKAGDVIATGAPLVKFKNYQDTGTVAGVIEEGDVVLEENPAFIIKSGVQIRATPAVRALAKSLEVNLEFVIATGINNTITAHDVQQAVQHGQDLSKYKKITGSRKAMAEVMARSHAEVVTVTICEDAKLSHVKPDLDISVSMMLALVAACNLIPQLNAWYDGARKSLQLLGTINLGIAMDTVDGLFVPVIKDLATKSANELRIELNTLKQQVSNRTIRADCLKGASITLSNFGKFAGRYASPIVIPPQVAILGVGKLRAEPIVLDGNVVVGQILPISLSVDHRVCTGGEAARFLGEVIRFLQAL